MQWSAKHRAAEMRRLQLRFTSFKKSAYLTKGAIVLKTLKWQSCSRLCLGIRIAQLRC